MLQKIKVYKHVYSESRTAKDFDQLLKDYYESIEKSTGGSIQFSHNHANSILNAFQIVYIELG